MSKIFYIIGPSSSGKDTLYKRILAEESLHLKAVTMYTTRPIRAKEQEGVEYHFVDDTTFQELQLQGKVIESRTYDTVHGLWNYFTVADDEIMLEQYDYLMIGVVDSFLCTREYFGQNRVIPLYIQVEDGIRLQRALNREKKQKHPKYKEMCRRYLADLEDFNQQKLQKSGINKRFKNYDLVKCTLELIQHIQDIQGDSK
ncbi:MAG: guanylate kinase [Eubacteriales bacterium]